jgi:outer membrane lipase/esterase
MRFKSLLAAMLVSSVSSIAMAQTYSNVISFGDSLTDNGNLFGLTGNPPPPYFNGRFSNGPTFAEILAGRIRPQAGPNGTMYNFGQAALGGNVNYAFGGARADNNLNLNGPIPSVQTQIGAFNFHGGTIGANSLVTLWAGANDIFQTATVYDQAAINNSALQMRNSLLMLSGLGARTIIIMNLPDLGRTPAYAGGPGAGLATIATNAYNTAQDTQITAARAAAAPGTNIIRVNANAISAQILANPLAFGFTNVTSQCVMTAACIGGNAAAQAGYFFWDSVHPTTSAHALFANIIQQYAQYGTVASTTHSLAEVGLTLRQSNIGRSLDRMANARYGGWPSEKGEMTLTATFDYLSNNGGGNRTAYSGHAEGAQLTYARSSGAAVAYGGQLSGQFGNVTQGLLKYSPLSLSMDGWVTGKFGATFVNLAAGASYNSYGSYNRGSGVGNLNMTASPSGSSLGAALQVGHGIKTGAITLTPSATLSVLNAKVGGYNETGLVAPLALSARSLTAVMGSVEMRADMPINAALSGHGLVGYQALLAVSGNSVTAGLSDNPVTPFTTALSQIAGNGFYVGAGLSGKITGAAVMSLDYRGGYTNGANHKLTGGIKIAF